MRIDMPGLPLPEEWGALSTEQKLDAMYDTTRRLCDTFTTTSQQIQDRLTRLDNTLGRMHSEVGREFEKVAARIASLERCLSRKPNGRQTTGG